MGAETGYSIVDQFCRAGELQTHFFRRCQREMRDVVLPALELLDQHGGPDAVAAKLAELDALKAAKEQKKQAKAGVPA